MESYQPGIVVAAFNRADSLTRILKSIACADYPSRNIPLIISIDKSDNLEVAKIAHAFEWKFGIKTVIEQPENLGLRKHILRCGDLTEKYESIILLEDDLYVSPHFYRYTQKALNTYGGQPEIAGVSLYSHRYNETAFMRFTPVKDEHDAYFMQIPSSWGQALTRQQWSGFRKWYDQNSSMKISSTSEVPPNVVLWPETSWKKYYFKYVIQNGLYFVYPYVSLSTNFADIGTHHMDNRTSLQVPLQRHEINYRFPAFGKSGLQYDSYCELTESSFKALCPLLRDYEVEIDLYGLKDLEQVHRPYLLTSKKIEGPAIHSFGRQFKPQELNLIYGNTGNIFHLVKTEQASSDPIHLINSTRNSYYYNIPELFLIKNPDEVRSDDRVSSDAKVMNAYHELQALQSHMSFKLFRLVFGVETKLKSLLGSDERP